MWCWPLFKLICFILKINDALMRTYSYLLYCANGIGGEPCSSPFTEVVAVKTEENGESDLVTASKRNSKNDYKVCLAVERLVTYFVFDRIGSDPFLNRKKKKTEENG